jgi:hypothetical protein
MTQKYDGTLITQRTRLTLQRCTIVPVADDNQSNLHPPPSNYSDRLDELIDTLLRR